MNKILKTKYFVWQEVQCVKLKKIVGGEGCVLYEFLDLVDDRENLRGSAIAGDGSFYIKI